MSFALEELYYSMQTQDEVADVMLYRFSDEWAFFLTLTASSSNIVLAITIVLMIFSWYLESVGESDLWHEQKDEMMESICLLFMLY
jgi:hypothetical protein